MQPREFWSAVVEARRQAGQHAGRWREVAFDVVDEEGRRVCRCQSVGVARFIALTHNILLPMVNFVLTHAKKAKDQETMRND